MYAHARQHKTSMVGWKLLKEIYISVSPCTSKHVNDQSLPSKRQFNAITRPSNNFDQKNGTCAVEFRNAWLCATHTPLGHHREDCSLRPNVGPICQICFLGCSNWLFWCIVVKHTDRNFYSGYSGKVCRGEDFCEGIGNTAWVPQEWWDLAWKLILPINYLKYFTAK